MEFNQINTTSYEGQMLIAALVILSTELKPEDTMVEIIEKVDRLRKDMGYQTIQDKIIEAAEAVFNTKFIMSDTGIPYWCPPNCPTKPPQ